MLTQVHSHSSLGHKAFVAAGNRAEPGLGDIMDLHVGVSVADADKARRTTFNGTGPGFFSGVGEQMLLAVFLDGKASVTALDSAQPGLFPTVPLQMDHAAMPG